MEVVSNKTVVDVVAEKVVSKKTVVEDEVIDEKVVSKQTVVEDEEVVEVVTDMHDSELNKQAINMLVEEGPEKAVNFMFNPTGERQLSYAEMRARFG